MESKMTMADHAKEWGKSQGLVVPEYGSAEWQNFFAKWHSYAFADFAPNRPYSYMLLPIRRSSRANEMTLKERQKFPRLACAWLESLPGAIRDDSYDFKVDTIYGPLAITANDNAVMTRFDDEELAMPVTMSRTGKWNHYYFNVSDERITALELLEYFQGLLIPLLKQKPKPAFPCRVCYRDDAGKLLVLVCEVYRTFKAHWIEDAEGRKLTKPAFYDPEAIRLILEQAA